MKGLKLEPRLKKDEMGDLTQRHDRGQLCRGKERKGVFQTGNAWTLVWNGGSGLGLLEFLYRARFGPKSKGDVVTLMSRGLM